ncbi:MAG: thioesterase family protein [Aquidulcibacter sp.]|jgi:acyl-CoA thioester hydrolase|uniref:acyl-CoA thioesterase n=1 Tax=Aquidulcibacter sp. TaxID=2052990 RepID=UPI0022BB9FEB|nr:thioesterase family protein [Aquidulcibacter sp.]MCE2990582.1 acyl-CoA thioesterase [Nitrosomonadaceae bacterium]MCZ8208147.1 thioesterase family protein [Aquidulcibacter sp.]
MDILTRPPGPTLHEFAITAQADDIDFMGHVNNARYLNWLQAAVLDHWHKIAPAAEHTATLWIALRHDIRYLKPSYVGQRMTIAVQLLELKGARATYRSTVKRGAELISTIDSMWCSLNASNLKPRRISKALVKQLLSL